MSRRYAIVKLYPERELREEFLEEPIDFVCLIGECFLILQCSNIAMSNSDYN